MSTPKTLYERFKETQKAFREALLGGSPTEVDDAERAYHEACLAYGDTCEGGNA